MSSPLREAKAPSSSQAEVQGKLHSVVRSSVWLLCSGPSPYRAAKNPVISYVTAHVSFLNAPPPSLSHPCVWILTLSHRHVVPLPEGCAQAVNKESSRSPLCKGC